MSKYRSNEVTFNDSTCMKLRVNEQSQQQWLLLEQLAVYFKIVYLLYLQKYTQN